MLNFKYNNDKNILNPNYTYHGEALCRPKHNVCIYERTPKNYFILFDIFDNISNKYVSPEIKKLEADRVGFEIVQTFYQNDDPNQNPYDICKNLIDQIENQKINSCLGGTPEGIVLKHHDFNKNGKSVATKLKLVTTKFKERHSIKQPKVQLSSDEFLTSLGNSFCTEARFHKSYQHLVEDNSINPSNLQKNDKNKILKELDKDFDKEYKDELKELLYVEFSPLLKKLAREGAGNWFTKTYLSEEKSVNSLSQNEPHIMPTIDMINPLSDKNFLITNNKLKTDEISFTTKEPNKFDSLFSIGKNIMSKPTMLSKISGRNIQISDDIITEMNNNIDSESNITPINNTQNK